MGSVTLDNHHRKAPGRVPAILTALAIAALAAPAHAVPMIYKATVVTDVRLNGTLYSKAAVTVTFRGNTRDIATVTDGSGAPVQSGICKGTGYFSYLAKGEAEVAVESHGTRTVGHFAPGQLFVALDSCNGGIGFGSFTGPAGLEPAYPLAFTRGTAMAFAVNQPNALATAGHMSGAAWSCIGFPPDFIGSDGKGNGFCTAPDPYPLQTTDAGEVIFYMPYTNINVSDGSLIGDFSASMMRGTFSIMAPREDE